MYLSFFFLFFEARNIHLFGWKRFVYVLKGFCLGGELPRLCPGASTSCNGQRGVSMQVWDSLAPATSALPLHVPQAFGRWCTLRDAGHSTKQS